MVPSAFIDHQLPGRVRLRIPSKRGDRSFFETAKQSLSGNTAVKEVSANPTTGSLLIRYSGDIGSLESEAARRGIFSLDRGQPTQKASKPTARARPATPAVPTTTALGLSGLGLYQLSRGRALGSASENFWNAYGAYRMLNSPALALLLCGLGVWQSLRGEWLGSASALLFYAVLAQKLTTGELPAVPQESTGSSGPASRRRGEPGPA